MVNTMQHNKTLNVALVAHDALKPAMTDWAKRHQQWLKNCQIYTTGTTGEHIQAQTDLQVTRLLSGPLGGDQQIGAMIAEKRLDLLIFFFDPLYAAPHDVDVKALIRIAAVAQIALATNERTAELLIQALSQTTQPND